MKQVIISDLDGLLNLLSKDKRISNGDVKLKISQLDAKENEEYERVLNKWLNACGCETGAIFCVVSICGYMVLWFLKSESFGWVNIKNGLIIIFSSALIGKLTGIFLARIRLRMTVRNVINRLD